MIRTSIHTPRPFTGSLAGAILRAAASWMALMWVGCEGTNYQPKHDRQGDLEQVI